VVKYRRQYVAVDDSPAALPYVHDATGDVADASSPEAEAYVHDATGDVAEPYVHVEPVAAPVVAAPSLTLPTLTPTAPTPTWLLVPTSLLPPPRLR